MAITIKTKYDFWKKIQASSPAEDGSIEISEFEVQFSYNPAESKIKFAEIMEALPNEAERLGTDFMKSTIINWRGVGGEDGKELDFSKEVLEQVLNTPWFATALLQGWTDAIKGNPQMGN